MSVGNRAPSYTLAEKVRMGVGYACIGAGTLVGGFVGADHGAHNGRAGERRANQHDVARAAMYRHCAETAVRLTAGGRTAVVRLGDLKPQEQRQCGLDFSGFANNDHSVAPVSEAAEGAGARIEAVNPDSSLVRLPDPGKMEALAAENLQSGRDFSHGREVTAAAGWAVVGGFGGLIGGCVVGLMLGGIAEAAVVEAGRVTRRSGAEPGQEI